MGLKLGATLKLQCNLSYLCSEGKPYEISGESLVFTVTSVKVMRLPCKVNGLDCLLSCTLCSHFHQCKAVVKCYQTQSGNDLHSFCTGVNDFAVHSAIENWAH